MSRARKNPRGYVDRGAKAAKKVGSTARRGAEEAGSAPKRAVKGAAKGVGKAVYQRGSEAALGVVSGGASVALSAWRTVKSVKNGSPLVKVLVALALAGVVAVIAVLFAVIMTTTAILSAIDPSEDCAGGGNNPDTPSGYLPQGDPSDLALGEIPSEVLDLYRRAAEKYGLDWAVIASVGAQESNHNAGRSLDDTGDCVMNNEGSGATGPMQFMPPTWAEYGEDGNGDGEKDPCNYEDAVFAAARYLKALGAPEDYDGALFTYSGGGADYPSEVMARAEQYRAQDGGESEKAEGARDPSPRVGLPVPVENADKHGYYWEPGVDEAASVYAPAGTEVYAITDGTVREAGGEGTPEGALVVEAAGNAGPVRKGDLLRYDPSGGDLLAEPGDEVRAGQQIAEIGRGFSVKKGQEKPRLDLGWYDPRGERAEAATGAMDPYPLLEYLKDTLIKAAEGADLDGETEGDAGGGGTARASAAAAEEDSGLLGDAASLLGPREAEAELQGWDLVNDGERQLRYNEYTSFDSALNHGVAAWQALGSVNVAPAGGGTAEVEIGDASLGGATLGITYSDGSLYFNPDLLSSATDNAVKTTASHELAHALGGDHTAEPSVVNTPIITNANDNYETPTAFDEQWYYELWGTEKAPGWSPPSAGGPTAPGGGTQGAAPCQRPGGPGGGGPRAGGTVPAGSGEVADLLNTQCEFWPNAVDDLEQGWVYEDSAGDQAGTEGGVDARLVAALQPVCAEHRLLIPWFKTGHSFDGSGVDGPYIDGGYGAAGGLPNTHYWGRAVDIFEVDGVGEFYGPGISGYGGDANVVDVGNILLGLSAQDRPDQMIGPSAWNAALGASREQGFILDGDQVSLHEDHLHLGFMNTSGTNNTS